MAAAEDIAGYLRFSGDIDQRVFDIGAFASADDLAGHLCVTVDDDGGISSGRRRSVRIIRIVVDITVAAAEDGASGGFRIRINGNHAAGDGDAAVALDLSAPGAAADDRIDRNRAAVDVEGAAAVDGAAARSQQESGVQFQFSVIGVGFPDVHRGVAVNGRRSPRIPRTGEIRIAGPLSLISEGRGEEVCRDVAVDLSIAAARQRIVDLPAGVGVVDVDQVDDDSIRVDHGIFRDVCCFRRGVDLGDTRADHGNRLNTAGDVEQNRIIGRETLHRIVHSVERVESVVRRGSVDEGHLIIGASPLPRAVDVKFLRAIRPDQIEVVVNDAGGIVVIAQLNAAVIRNGAGAGVVDQLVDSELRRVTHINRDRAVIVVQNGRRNDLRSEIHGDRAAVFEDAVNGVVRPAEVVDRQGRAGQRKRAPLADHEPHVTGSVRAPLSDIDLRTVLPGENTLGVVRTDEELAGEFPFLTGGVERTAVHDNRGGGVGAFRRGSVVLVIVTYRRADGHDAGVGRAGDVHQAGLRTVGIRAAGVAGTDRHDAVERAVDVQRTQNIAGFLHYRECRTFGDVDRAGRVDVRIGDLRRRTGLHIVGAAVGGVPRVGLESGSFAGGDIHRDPLRTLAVVHVILLGNDFTPGEFAAQRHFRAGSNEQIVSAAGKGDICAVEEVERTVDLCGDRARSGNVDRTGVLQRHADCQGRRCHIDGSLVFN